jgi:hypothetical protein
MRVREIVYSLVNNLVRPNMTTLPLVRNDVWSIVQFLREKGMQNARSADVLRNGKYFLRTNSGLGMI